MTNSNKFNIFDEYSKTSENYNYDNNVKLWNNNAGVLHINYLIYIINCKTDEKIDYVVQYKPYDVITSTPDNIK